FDRALANVLAVVAAADATPESVVRLTIYVVDTREYLAAQREIGERYRARMGRHYPAMTLVEVRALLEPGAVVEIEATAVLE
ncbi:MAG TPA: RidA family protein, partial [Vicinamibacterales bacterium]|nr:RidA family protein [Vicinamibacterales bacterium]